LFYTETNQKKSVQNFLNDELVVRKLLKSLKRSEKMTVTETIQMIAMIASPIAAAFGSSALTKHRLDRLERKVDEHNHFDSRIARVEESCASAHKRIDGN
jgi:hypothetical protein